MKQIRNWNLVVPTLLCAGTILSGCSGGNSPSPEAAARDQQELAALKKANEQVVRLKSENSELPRLQKDNAELQRLKSVPSELEKAKTENVQLRAALGIGPQEIVAVTSGGSGSGANGAPTVTGINPGLIVPSKKPPVDPDTVVEGDEILMEPRLLALLMPEYGTNLSNFQRRSPIGVAGVLKDRGFVFTNYNQLRQLGITNFSIQRAPEKPESEPQP